MDRGRGRRMRCSSSILPRLTNQTSLLGMSPLALPPPSDRLHCDVTARRYGSCISANLRASTDTGTRHPSTGVICLGGSRKPRSPGPEPSVSKRLPRCRKRGGRFRKCSGRALCRNASPYFSSQTNCTLLYAAFCTSAPRSTRHPIFRG